MGNNDNIKTDNVNGKNKNATQWESAAGCASLLDAVSEGVIIADRETRQFRYSNPSICKMLGYTREEMSLLSVQDIHPKKDLANIFMAFESMVEGERKNVEVPCLRKDGSVFFASVSISSVAINDSDSVLGFFTDISDRKKVEERDALFKILFYASADAIMTTEPPLWRFTAGNPATLKMFMVKGEAEFNSMEPWQLSPEKQPDGRLSSEKSKEMLDIAMRDGTNFFEWTHKRSNGEEFPATVLLARVSTAEKTFIQATVRDISRQKKLEEKLADSEERYRFLVENSHDIIYLLNAKGIFTFVSSSWTNLLGHHPDQVIGKPFMSFIHPDDVERCIFALKEMVRTGKRLDEIEYRVRHLDGTWRWHVSSGAPAKGEDGEVTLFEGIAKDITEKKRAEDMLRENEAFLSNIVENIPDMIFVKEAKELRFVRFNRAGEDLIGYPKSEMLGKNDYDFFPATEADHFTSKDRIVLQNKKLLDIPEETIQTKNKGERFLHTKKIPILDAEGNPEYLLGISEDITESKKVADALQKKNIELENLNKFMVDREVKMVALKKEMAELKERLGNK